MSGVNPQGVQVVSFKKPSAEELDHDFLWRTSKALPERGRIGIFNRSHYEEVVALKVHPEWLGPQRLPPGERDEHFWQERYEDINTFERHLDRTGTKIVKFFLHVSKDVAEAALPRPARHAGQGMEVQRRRRHRACPLGRLHERLRGRADRHLDALGAVVRHPGRPQATDAGPGRAGAGRNGENARPALARGLREGPRRESRGTPGARGRDGVILTARRRRRSPRRTARPPARGAAAGAAWPRTPG